MWEFMVYTLIVIILVLISLVAWEIKRSREHISKSLPIPAIQMASKSESSPAAEQLVQLSTFPPLITEVNGDIAFTGQKTVPTAVSIIISLLFLAAGAAILGWCIHLTHQGFASRGWPTVPGKIISSAVIESKDSEDRPMYQATVRYTYSIAGVTYKNNKVSFVSTSSSDRSAASRITARYPAGKTIPVRYDPSHPETAVLEPGLSTNYLLLYGIGGAFILTSALFIYLAAKRRPTARPRF